MKPQCIAHDKGSNKPNAHLVRTGRYLGIFSLTFRNSLMGREGRGPPSCAANASQSQIQLGRANLEGIFVGAERPR